MGRAADRQARAALALFALFSLIALFATVPMLWPGTAAAASARWVFAGLCHQQAARSFLLDGHTMAVCHRCAGLYAGIPLGALGALAVAVDPSRRGLWFAGAVPLALHVAASWAWPAIDLWWLRAITGLVAGAVGGLLLSRALAS